MNRPEWVKPQQRIALKGDIDKVATIVAVEDDPQHELDITIEWDTSISGLEGRTWYKLSDIVDDWEPV